MWKPLSALRQEPVPPGVELGKKGRQGYTVLENQHAEEYRCLAKSLQKEEGIDSPQNVKQIKLRQYVRVALLGIGNRHYKEYGDVI